MRKTRTTILTLLLLAAARVDAAVRFDEVSERAGVRVLHDCFGVYPDGVQEQNFYGSGLAWVDLNQDGWLDLVLANGEVGASVFLNNGDGTFDDASDLLVLAAPSAGTGVAWADVDNDGDLDASMVNSYGEPYFFRGGGNYVESGKQVGVNPLYDPAFPPPDNWIGPQSMGTAFGDIDRDGHLDLYVANYGVFQRDMLFMGNGNGFSRTTVLHAVEWAHAFQPVFFDFDNDRDVDIYVANDFGKNYLFENGGRSTGFSLTERAQRYRVSGGGGWPAPASLSMGVAVGDYDNDLDLDLYVTNYVENALYENVGLEGELWVFNERAAAAGVQYLNNSWGTEFGDWDLDGDLDLVLTAGWIHSQPVLDQGKHLDDRIYLNDGGPDWTFTDITDASDFGTDQLSGRGLATADYDRDGDLDIGVWYNTLYENDSPPVGTVYEGEFHLYENQQDEAGNWLILKLTGDGAPGGDGCNRSAVGARVQVTTSLGVQMREVQAGGSYLSQSSMELEFGLGPATGVSRVRVTWLCGGRQTYTGVQVNGIYELVEGETEARLTLTTPTQLSAAWTDGGMQLSWHFAPWLTPEGAMIERAVDEPDPSFETLEISTELDRSRGRGLDDTAAENTAYVYRITLQTPHGEADPMSVAATSQEYNLVELPTRTRLGQNFPNPFNPRTTIVYDIPSRMHVKLVLYDLRGRWVRTLVDEIQDADQHQISWDGKDQHGNKLASGTYIYSLQTEEGSHSRRLTLLH